MAIKNKYTLLRISDLMDQLVGACVFSKINVVLQWETLKSVIEI